MAFRNIWRLYVELSIHSVSPKKNPFLVWFIVLKVTDSCHPKYQSTIETVNKQKGKEIQERKKREERKGTNIHTVD